MIYEYNKDLLKHFINDNIEMFNPYIENSNMFTGDKITDSIAKRIYQKLKKQLYLIAPNPVNNTIVFLVYEANDNVSYFYEYDHTKDVQRNLQKQYYKINPNFQLFVTYDYFINHLDFYKELKLTSMNILLADGYIYDYEDMTFKKKVYELPSNKTDLIYKELKENDKKILDNCFNIMYDSEDTIKQFLYYMLCTLNKGYAKQSIFLVVDISGVGKTSKILCTVDLGLNELLDSGLLKKSELYNIAYKNNVIYNETQAENINGSTLSQIADNAPLTVTRKGESSLTINKRDKPLLQLMGEGLPHLKSLNDGTNRRFLLVPKGSKKFIEFIENPNNENTKNIFYDILNNKPIQVIQYYTEKLEEYDIINNMENIRKTMNVTLRDLEVLSENKEEIFSRYFEVLPIGKYEECNTNRFLIDSGKSLDNYLEYIDNNIITISHFNDTALRRKYLRKLIKENINSTVKELGNHNIQGKNYFYYYCLTPEGLELLEKINKEKVYPERLEYIIK